MKDHMASETQSTVVRFHVHLFWAYITNYFKRGIKTIGQKNPLIEI